MGKLISDKYIEWQSNCNARFNKVKENETKINEIMSRSYGLNDETNIPPNDDEISIYRADLARDIKSLISYAVGCIFGRYSLDYEGVVYAGGVWDETKYKTFSPDKDGIIPICDDEYFDDDIVALFSKFIATVYGNDTLEANLTFIAKAINKKEVGSPKQTIRNYFINSFFDDHCNMYSIANSGKRPIYWLFDSGKKNGFKALVYMHRYQPDTLARMRTDYIHEQQARYRTAIDDVTHRMDGASTSERVKLNKTLQGLQDQAEEIRVYEEKVHHLADQMIRIDLDDGVKHNYEIFKDVLAPIK